MNKNYSSIYNIKDFLMNQIAPKYWDMEDINHLNVGLLGYVTESMGTLTDDVANMVTNYMKEIFPNRAIIPESLYNYMALFQMEDLFAVPAQMDTVIFLLEDEIMKFGTVNDNQIEFTLDSLTKIMVENKQFMLDYDVKIICKNVRGQNVFSAIYDMSTKNDLSTIKNPFVKCKSFIIERKNYVGLFVTLRQVDVRETDETIINNDKINMPVIDVRFENQLANFEVFYKAPGAKDYTQLKKRLINSPPIKDEFCYYKFKSDNEIEISFTSKDFYFKPSFNSEILVRYYTTTGEEGNFEKYAGDDVRVIPRSTKYPYNNNIISFAMVQSASIHGKNKMSLDELRPLIVEKFSTVASYTTENDLKLYFSELRQNNVNVSFIKKRDDVFERMFGAFILLNDNKGECVHTNTLTYNANTTDFDIEYDQTDRWILKPGHLFEYKEDSLDTVTMIPDKTINSKDVQELEKDKFLFANPFLVAVSKRPGSIGYYINSCNSTHALNYSYLNMETSTQFICNNVYVKRNSLLEEDEYTLTVRLLPSSAYNKDIILFDDDIKVIGIVKDNDAESCYFNFEFSDYEQTGGIFEFKGKIKTDDYITNTNKMRALNARAMITGEEIVKTIPMTKCNMSILVFTKVESDERMPHQYEHLENLDNYNLSNIYTLEDEDSRIDFITPVGIIRSRLKFLPGETKENYSLNIYSTPFVRAGYLADEESIFYLLDNIRKQHHSLSAIKELITNNYSIDLKFYNTYGRSRTFVAGEERELLDELNIKLKIHIAPSPGADDTALVNDVKLTIKKYIETVNETGTNGIYVSNLIQILENQYPEIRYLKFEKLNKYPTTVQVIESVPISNSFYSPSQKRDFVPEYMNISLKDITINII